MPVNHNMTKIGSRRRHVKLLVNAVQSIEYELDNNDWFDDRAVPQVMWEQYMGLDIIGDAHCIGSDTRKQFAALLRKLRRNSRFREAFRKYLNKVMSKAKRNPRRNPFMFRNSGIMRRYPHTVTRKNGTTYTSWRLAR